MILYWNGVGRHATGLTGEEQINNRVILIVSHRRNELLLTHNLHQQQRPVSALNKTIKRPPVTAKKSSKVELTSQPNKIQATQSKAVIEATTKVNYLYNKVLVLVKHCSMCSSNKD